jgi:DNA-binding transcriptional regulator YiaG
VVTERLPVAGVTFRGRIRAQVCGSCGESLVTARELGRLELAAAHWLSRAGLRTPESFRFMRKAMGLRATDLAALLGVTEFTVSRWETGAIDVEPRAFALLGALVSDELAGTEDTRARLDALRATRRRVPAVVRLDVA